MAVVEDFYLGNTHIQICDDYCRDVTQEEVDKILKRIGEIVSREYARQAAEKRQTKKT